MATQDLMQHGETVDTSKDNVVIDKNLETLRGGRTLDVEGFADDTIQAGHVVVKEDATGDYKPLPVNGTVPVDHTPVGILTVSILKSKPEAAIMLRGTVNEVHLKYPISSAVKTALGAQIGYVNY